MKKFLATVLIFCIVLLGTLTTPSLNDQSTDTGNIDDFASTEGTGNVPITYNVSNHGKLPVGGNLNISEEYIWYITSNSSGVSSALLFEDVQLDVGDNLTVSPSGNETTIFGPYSGPLGPLVIAVDEKDFVVKLSTSANKMSRAFTVMYSESCSFVIPPSIDVVKSPIYRETDKIIRCTYDYNKIHEDISYSFVFKNFSLDSKSSFEVVKGSQTGNYTKTPPDIFGPLARFMISVNANYSGNTMTIYRRDLNSTCSGFIQLPSPLSPVLGSPPALKLHNDSMKFECRWLIKASSYDKILGLLMEKLQFSSVFDMLIINDGPSELASPIIQAGFTSQNETRARVIRTSGPYLWVSFKSEYFASNFSGNYSEGRGGYFTGSGNISVTPDSETMFLLEVAPDEKVLLNFSLPSFAGSPTISIFNGFDTTSTLIAQLNGTVWYPVVSDTSQMRVVVKGGTFNATFSGIKSDCIHMSTSSNDAYVMSGNCDSSCAWIVPPKNVSGGVLLLEFQLLSLEVSDVVEVYQLNNSKVSVAEIVYGTKHVPPLTFSPREGFYVKISRGACTKKDNDIILVAHLSYLPGCSGSFSLMPSSEVQLFSPNYPNMYPLFASCEWIFIASGNTRQFYLSFDSMKLAPNHYIEIIQNSTKTVRFSGDQIPGDMLVGNMTVRFDSSNSSGVLTSLASDAGFVLNIIGSDCGSSMTENSGQFSTNLTVSKGKSSCFWIIEVPFKESDGSSNSIEFTVEEKGEVKNNNSEFHVYDGSSLHYSQIFKDLTGNVWSHNSTVIFVYKRINSSVASALYTVKYKTINCNRTMQCDNGICLHPDWLCDQKNDCGDYSDEKNCGTVPIPDSIKQSSGVSSVAFGLVTVLFFGLGALAAFLIPKAISRYRSGRYHQFQDYSGVD